MAKQTVTIYISDTAIRTIMTDGKQIKEWAELQLEPGLIENNVILEEETVAEKIKQLLDVQAIKARKVVVGISGIRCLTRPILLPKLPKEILDEAVKREAERLLPVSLDELYLSWQTIPAPEENTQVFLAAIPRRTVDPLMHVLSHIGLKPSFMDLKPLLLARIAQEETTIMVDVQGVDFDIVVMVNGVPQPIRTVPFPGEGLSWQDKLPIIRDELDRTVTFYNTNNPDTAVEADVPVFASGYLGDESEFCRMLSEEVGRSVIPLPSPLESPEGFDPSVYMANIGMILQESASGQTNGSSVVSLNMLPAAYKPQPISSGNILKMLGVVAAIIVLVGLYVVMQNTASSIDSKRASLVTTNELLQQSRAKTSELRGTVNDLDTQIADLETAEENFTAALGNLEQLSVAVNRDIEATMESKPSSIDLTGVDHDNGILTISGKAQSEKSVLNYILALDATGRFSDIEVTDMAGQEDGSMEFTLMGRVLVETDWVSSVQVVLGNLPNSITLTTATSGEGALTLEGNSPDEEKLMLYLEKLEASGKFSEIAIVNITRVGGGGMDFSVVLRIGG